MTPDLYEQDFIHWLTETAHLLQEGRFNELDIPNLVDEIDGMVRSDKRSLKSNLVVILSHLLKWKYQQQRRTTSWELTILEHRNRVQDLIEDSPSLKSYMESVFDECYRRGLKEASVETQLALATFPTECPFTVEQALSVEFLPGDDA